MQDLEIHQFSQADQAVKMAICGHQNSNFTDYLQYVATILLKI